mgnify:CR=1 FL=1
MVSKEIINSFNEKELQVYQYVEANKEKDRLYAYP